MQRICRVSILPNSINYLQAFMNIIHKYAYMYMCLQTMFVILCTRFMNWSSVTSMSYEELKEQYLQFSVYDFDRFSRNDLIGQVVLKELLDCTEQEIEYTMEILCAMQVTNMNFRHSIRSFHSHHCAKFLYFISISSFI